MFLYSLSVGVLVWYLIEFEDLSRQNKPYVFFFIRDGEYRVKTLLSFHEIKTIVKH